MRRLSRALALSLLVACAPQGSSSPPRTALRNVAASLDSPPGPEATREPTAGVVVELASDPDTEGRMNVVLRLEGPSARITSLRFQPTHAARIDRLVIADARGVIATRQELDGSATRFTLGRPVTGALGVRYSVFFGPAAGGDGYSPVVEPVEFRVGGEDTLLLPEVDGSAARVPLELHLRTGLSSIDAASSFGLGLDQHTTARASDLQNAFFVSGEVGKAEFHTTYGDDLAAWIGSTRFDPRWVSAEIAGVRTSIDAFMGRAPGFTAPPVSTLVTVVQSSEPPIVVATRTRGLVIVVDRRAAWSSAARLLVAQALTQRYLGGFLQVGERRDDSAGAFFADGFSRAIAREILFEGGLFDHADRAAELDLLLARTVFAEDPRELASARGALLATALDVAIKTSSHGERTLRSFIRERLEQAANEKRDTISRGDFMSKIRESAGEAHAHAFDASLNRGTDVALPAGLLAPCYRLVQKELVPFELGFVTGSGEELTVLSVKHGSRAEAAGVRTGDIVTKLHYEAGRSSIPVDLVLKRGARDVPLRFLPAGRSKPGRLFERISGIPNDRC